MGERRRKGALRNAAFLGAASAVVYVLHVWIGGILCEGYDHKAQSISELTGSGAPNAGWLRILTMHIACWQWASRSWSICFLKNTRSTKPLVLARFF